MGEDMIELQRPEGKMATATLTLDSGESVPTQWTDDQESALLRAIIRYKPVGIHKHFRMIAIRNYMFSQGVINLEDQHTTASGIWKKLETIYDLSKLDEREDSILNNGVDDKGDVVAYWRDFELPRDEYEGLLWQRRLAPDDGSSPAWSRRESTIADTDEPRSSPVSVRGSARGGRGGVRRGGRLSKLQNELETKRSSRRTSKTGSIADEDQIMDDVGDEDEEHESDEQGDEETDDQDEEERKGISRRGGRGARRVARGRRGRRRG